MDKWKAYAAKPRNRPRLSLQDSKYYDARGLKRSMHRMELVIEVFVFRNVQVVMAGN